MYGVVPESLVVLHLKGASITNCDPIFISGLAHWRIRRPCFCSDCACSLPLGREKLGNVESSLRQGPSREPVRRLCGPVCGRLRAPSRLRTPCADCCDCGLGHVSSEIC